MGMFDYVHFEIDCPKCSAVLKGFQTKCLSREMITVEPDFVQNFYAACQKCSTWIEFSRPGASFPPLRDKSLSTEQVAAMGFVMKIETK